MSSATNIASTPTPSSGSGNSRALPSQPELATGDLAFSSTLPLSQVLVASLPISPSKLEAHTSTGPILPLSWWIACGCLLSSCQCQTLRLWVFFMRSDPRSRHSARRLLSITISDPQCCGGFRGMIYCLALPKLALVHWSARPCGCANLAALGFWNFKGRTRRDSLHLTMSYSSYHPASMQSKAVARCLAYLDRLIVSANPPFTIHESRVTPHFRQ